MLPQSLLEGSPIKPFTRRLRGASSQDDGIDF